MIDCDYVKFKITMIDMLLGMKRRGVLAPTGALTN